MRPLSDVLTLPAGIAIRKSEMDPLIDAGVFHFVPNLGKLRVRTRIVLGWERVSGGYLEGHLVGVEEQRYGTQRRTGKVICARRMVRIGRGRYKWRPGCCGPVRFGVAVIITELYCRFWAPEVEGELTVPRRDG